MILLYVMVISTLTLKLQRLLGLWVEVSRVSVTNIVSVPITMTYWNIILQNTVITNTLIPGDPLYSSGVRFSEICYWIT